MVKKIFFITAMFFAFACVFTIYTKNIMAQEGSDSDKKEVTISEKININTGTQEDFEKIKGIGPGLAKKIIEYRESHGNFESIEDIINVKGIGKKKLEKIKDCITISDEK
ncbi:MAG: ComEA family DNA-binding protein [Thermodesulfobacteriota bacterium]|nr:ComEA family DNA-binding protein [Thermodesulfobacteriota bacterium]